MSDYSQSAEFYDVLHAGDKDYAAEAGVVAGLIREAAPRAESVLDVGCGTGKHAEQLVQLGFAVDGIDLEPAFVRAAAARCPLGTFQVADMTSFALSRRYDAVVCLFSAIGYARTAAALDATLSCMAAHIAPGGVVIIDPWFEPGQLTDRMISASTHVAESMTVCRMSRMVLEGSISRFEFQYLIGRPGGIEHRSERHTMGLFTQPQMEDAFHRAGLRVERRREVLRRRGVYIGRLGAESQSPA